MQHLRADAGVSSILGYQSRLVGTETARQWLDKFHDESLMVAPLQGSFIPPESPDLAGLKEVRRRTVGAYIEAAHPGWDVTLDVDAPLTETSQANAKCCYEGYKAYQPIQVSWAETMLVLAEEFREGNVPAGKDISRLTDEAYSRLVGTTAWSVAGEVPTCREDSAAYDSRCIGRSLGWTGLGICCQRRYEPATKKGNGGPACCCLELLEDGEGRGNKGRD